MDQNLNAAAVAGDINMLYTEIQNDPFILDPIDHIPFGETPLHVAASLGHTMEIMRLRPLFAKKLDQDGYTLLHLALQNGKTNTVCRLVGIEPDLARVQGGEGITPLHCTTEEGNLELLTRFLSVCSSSIQDVTIKNETALHIIVKSCKFDAFDFLVGRLRITYHEGSNPSERDSQLD